MDYLRKLYRSSMRLYRDRPDVLTPGRWYWSPPGAKLIPYFHVFGSFKYDWTNPRCNPPVGEVPVWQGKSRRPTNPRYLGQNWCGSAEVWTKGALYSQRGTPAVDSEGIPVCCISGPAIPGGAVANGQSTFRSTYAGTLVGGGEKLGGGPPAINSSIGGGELLAGDLVAGGSPIGGGELLAGGVPGVESNAGVGEVLGGDLVAGGSPIGGSELLASSVSKVETSVGGGEVLGGRVSSVDHGLAGGGEVLGGDLVAGGAPIGGGELLGGDLVASGAPIGGGELLGGDLVAGGAPIGGGELLGAKSPLVASDTEGGAELLAGGELPPHGSALFTEPGDYYWICPPGVATFEVRCWGSGGEGNAAMIGTPGGGGGGGAFASSFLTGVPLMMFPLHVGNHLAAGGVADGTTTFGVGPLVSADCGGHRLPPGGQTPGLASLSIGTATANGGYGGLTGSGDGGGGGASAGPAGPGLLFVTGVSQPGAAGGIDAGSGGDGATVAVGANGTRPGGGGGGNIDPAASLPQGADGQVLIVW